jgi:HSP20 family protein
MDRVLKPVLQFALTTFSKEVSDMLWSDLERFGRFMEPWRELERMQRALSRWTSPSAVEFPAVNIWVSGDTAILTTELPGVDAKDIDISVVGKSLTLRGSREPEALKENESYHRRERWHGQFTKTVEAPFDIEAGKVEAKFRKGILSITLPRAEADKPKKITVKSE